ncbi:MAG TPA: DUF3443 domain-containing protein [Casimicrobiaceae bacterium]|nr:DUF3443 domain-containing protein [Casimicrobiaceae bacterium]
MTIGRRHRLLSVPALAVLLSLAACGGGGGSSSNQPTPNVQSLVVDGGPAQIPDLAYVSVTICAPGSSANCQTIDHVQVDTGSTGLRILASVLSPSLALPQQVDASGNPVAECAQFADGYSFGSVRSADIRIAGEQARGVPIQIIGDAGFPSIPASCSASGPPENTVQSFGANGLLGVGVFLQDCGGACAQAAIPGTYYTCPPSGCTPLQVPLAQQLQNPVALFASDNNGVIVQLPLLPATGAATATGSLIFGIGTQGDNALGAATVLTTDPGTGNIVTVWNGRTYTNSYIDAGTSLFAFGQQAYPSCVGLAIGFYCPATPQTLGATLQGTNARSSAVSFTIGNVDQLFAANYNFYAFDDVGGPGGDSATFAWGLPFFFGRSVYTAIEGRSTPGGNGPYFAF